MPFAMMGDTLMAWTLPQQPTLEQAPAGIGSEQIETFLKFPLKESAIDRIFYWNAAELLGIA
jgi:hypothetical protein